MSSFDLDSYITTTLLRPRTPEVGVLGKLGLVEAFTEKSHANVVLLDLGVRDLEDLKATQIPKMDTFIRKLEGKKGNIMDDKFMHIFDVGTESECQMVVARIPEKNYMKLELAKQILGTIRAPNIVVSVVGEFGEIMLDLDMSGALFSAWQSRDFNMPSLKGGKGASLAAAKKAGDDMRGKLLFLQPSTPLLAREEKENALQAFESFYDNPMEEANDKLENWHYFKDLSEDELEARKQKVRELEKALNRGTREAKDTTKGKERKEPSMDAVIQTTSKNVFRTPSQKSKDVNVEATVEHFENLAHVNHGTNIASALSSLPSNVLTPAAYSDCIRRLAEGMGWELTEWTPADLQELGCGGICAVTQGNEIDINTGVTSDRLFRLRYSPRPKDGEQGTASSKVQGSAVTLSDILRRDNEDNTPMNPGVFETDDEKIKIKTPIVLCGKGVTYDTGGINLKTANSMKTMKQDMAGSAAALGTLYALSKLDVRVPVECWLAVVENNTGPKSFRPDDVIHMITGESVEVVNSDAEGRVILADVLALASRKIRKSKVHSFSDTMSPRCVIDYATLTGTCITSLSNRFIGVMTNREEAFETIVKSGAVSGERLWPFPVDEDFGEDLKSDLADYLQCRQPIEADHIYAAYFLKKFVNPAVPWFHFDMGSSYRAGGLGHGTSDFTGCGVRSSISLLEHYF